VAFFELAYTEFCLPFALMRLDLGENAYKST
jgi:hypothetical protein